MNGKTLGWAVRVVAVLALTLGSVALGQEPAASHFSGVINDYTAFVPNASPGPYELRGTWSFDLDDESRSANFSAALTMEFSDAAITEGLVNVGDPGTRKAHTHHFKMKDAVVSTNTSTCPVNSPATTNPGFMITGHVTIAANGGPFPFDKLGPSTLQVCVSGGTRVPFSNVTLVFSGPATKHFGSQPIHGVITRAQ